MSTRLSGSQAIKLEANQIVSGDQKKFGQKNYFKTLWFYIQVSLSVAAEQASGNEHVLQGTWKNTEKVLEVHMSNLNNGVHLLGVQIIQLKNGEHVLGVQIKQLKNGVHDLPTPINQLKNAERLLMYLEGTLKNAVPVLGVHLKYFETQNVHEVQFN